MFYLLHIWGDVEPHLYGPYKTHYGRDRAARHYAKKDSHDGGFYKVYVNWQHGQIQVDAFTGDQLGRDA